MGKKVLLNNSVEKFNLKKRPKKKHQQQHRANKNQRENLLMITINIIIKKKVFQLK